MFRGLGLGQEKGAHTHCCAPHSQRNVCCAQELQLQDGVVREASLKGKAGRLCAWYRTEGLEAWQPLQREPSCTAVPRILVWSRQALEGEGRDREAAETEGKSPVRVPREKGKSSWYPGARVYGIMRQGSWEGNGLAVCQRVGRGSHV